MDENTKDIRGLELVTCCSSGHKISLEKFLYSLVCFDLILTVRDIYIHQFQPELTKLAVVEALRLKISSHGTSLK